MMWFKKDERFLKAFWLELSASRIAYFLGKGITRNAVIGKAHRMGLPAKAPRRKGFVTR